MFDALSAPWPWYVAGPLIGLIVPALLLIGGKSFGLSANLRHLCAAVPVPQRAKPAFLRYDWKATGLWNLAFVAGVAAGGALAFVVFGPSTAGADISASTRADLAAIGLTNFSGPVPAEWISWNALGTLQGWAIIAAGGFLVGFGARWAGGCTSGHAITGLAELQAPSLVAVAGFFAGGLLITYTVFG